MLNANGSIQEGSPTNLVPEAGNDTVRNDYEIHENAGVLGITARPMDTLRLNADFVLGYNDNSFTRISPRQVQVYKVSGRYSPKPWASLNASVDINENQDNVATVNNVEHGRTYSAVATLSHSSMFWVDFGYSYIDIYSQTLHLLRRYRLDHLYRFEFALCDSGIGGQRRHAGNAFDLCQPRQLRVRRCHGQSSIKRVTLGAGYNGSIVRGSTTVLNPLTPTGTLDFTYLKPFVSVAFDLYKGLSYKTAWNYYGYDTHGPGPINPVGLVPLPSQNFNGSNVTFSLRYLF